jgi:1-deoxy-D-xylulose-5-phosphate synthase
VVAKPKKQPSYSELFGRTLLDIGRTRPDVVAITAAMPDGTGLSCFRDEFPDRFFDVGIAEQHAVTFAAGLALKGLKPVVALYSTFLQRSFDQIMHDVALDSLNVTFCIDRSGIVGEDGPTHHGMFDLSFVRTVPTVLMMAPKNGSELVRMLYTAMSYDKGPVFIRYSRGGIPDEAIDNDRTEIPLSEPEVLFHGSLVAVVAIGDMVLQGQKVCDLLAKQGITPTLVNARFIKPLSQQFYEKLFLSHSYVVTLESNSVTGGFGSGMLECASSCHLPKPPKFLLLGYPDVFLEHGSNTDILKKIQLDPESIARRIAEFIIRP